MSSSTPVKRSISFVVFFGGGREGRSDWILVVRRPPDDPELPDVWGLPAASLGLRESWEDAVRRAGREKLGVELRPLRILREGWATRPSYRLHMRLFEADVIGGEPEVPQAVPGVTQYVEWRWAAPRRLEDAAARGSLCARLCLEAVGSGED